MIIIREPKTKEEFDSYHNLIWKLLRKPWNQPKGSEIDDLEDESFHFIAICKNKIVGVEFLMMPGYFINEKDDSCCNHRIVYNKFKPF